MRRARYDAISKLSGAGELASRIKVSDVDPYLAFCAIVLAGALLFVGGGALAQQAPAAGAAQQQQQLRGRLPPNCRCPAD
jgi:hypothetical protein